MEIDRHDYQKALEFIKEAGFGVGAGLGLYSAVASAHTGYQKAKELDDSEIDLLRDEYRLNPDANLKWENAKRGIMGGVVGSIPGALLASSKSAGPLAKMVGVAGSLGGGILGSHIMSGKYSSDGAEFVHDMRNNVLPEQIQALDIPLNAKIVLARYYNYDPELMK